MCTWVTCVLASARVCACATVVIAHSTHLYIAPCNSDVNGREG